MANTFKLKSKNNIGVSTVGIYTVPASTTTVIIGVTAANISGQGINVGIGISRGSIPLILLKINGSIFEIHKDQDKFDYKVLEIKFSNLFSNPLFANFDNSNSGVPFSLLGIDGKIGFDFFGLKLNLK